MCAIQRAVDASDFEKVRLRNVVGRQKCDLIRWVQGEKNALSQNRTRQRRVKQKRRSRSIDKGADATQKRRRRLNAT